MIPYEYEKLKATRVRFTAFKPVAEVKNMNLRQELNDARGQIRYLGTVKARKHLKERHAELVKVWTQRVRDLVERMKGQGLL